MPNSIPASSRRRAPAFLRLIDMSARVLAIVAALALLLLAVNVLVDVTGRAAFNKPYTGTLEMTSYWWMPTLTLLAFAYTEMRQEHIKVTILLDILPPVMRRVVEGTFGLLATGLLVMLAWHGLSEALEAAEYGQTTSSSPPLPIWPFKFLAPFGILALALQTAATSYRHFAGYLPLVETYQSDADTA